MIQFKNLKADLGEIKPGSTNKVIWEFEGNEEDIVKIQPGCGCTADCKVEGNTIIAMFTESDRGTKLQYPSGSYPVSKNVTVYLKDSEDLQIETPAGIVYNPNKKRETLTFIARVTV